MTGRFLIAACAAVVVAALALVPVTAQTDEHWTLSRTPLGRPGPAGRLGERLRNTAGATEAVR